MSLLSAADLDGMRDVLNQSLPDTAILMTRGLTSDGQGGSTQAYTAAGTVACRISPVSEMRAGGEEVHGDRHAAISERVITLPANTVITATDRIVVAAQTFEVTAIHAPRSWEISTRVDTVEVN